MDPLVGALSWASWLAFVSMFFWWLRRLQVARESVGAALAKTPPS